MMRISTIGLRDRWQSQEYYTLKSKLLGIRVNFNFKNILGGGNFTLTKQMHIVEHVAKFLFDT